MRPHRWQPTRLPHPWDSPGKNTGVGCHFLLQFMKKKSDSKVVQSCLTFHDPMDCSPPGFSVHGIFQARVLEWGAIAFSRRAVEMVGELKGSQWRESAGNDQAGPGWLNKGLTIYPEWEGQWKACRGWCQMLSEEMIRSRGGSRRQISVDVARTWVRGQ